MSVLEIIAAILLILACIFIVLVVLMQDSKQGMSQAISGASADNYFQKNSGRTKEAKLARLTRTAAIIVFVVALLVNLITIYGWGKSDGDSTVSTPTTTTTAAAEEGDGTAEGGDGSDTAGDDGAEDGEEADGGSEGEE